MNWIRKNNHLLIFLAGVLSFSIQLLETKRLLPLLGGSSSIWIGSLMFYQSALLVSYLVTYKISQLKSLKAFGIMIGISLLGSIGSFFLPLNTSYPLLSLIVKLLPSGFIYLLLLQISPLIQFFSKEENPYRYYASSNLGAFVGLLCYPFVFENFNLTTQIYLWWAVSTVIIAWAVFSLLIQKKESFSLSSPFLSWSKGGGVVVLYAAAGTFFLGGYSSLLSEDISGFPLLWVIPLLLYLLAFAIIFGPDQIRKPFSKILNYRKRILEYSIIVHLGNLFFVAGQFWALFFYVVTMFLIFLMIIEELYERSKTQHTSSFYLYIALGGAIGGIFNNILPFIWPLGQEMNLGLIALFSYYSYSLANRTRIQKIRDLIVAVFFLGVFGYFQKEKLEGNLTVQRNFFGILTVFQLPESLPDVNSETSEYETNPIKVFNHGKITHGTQSLIDPSLPTTYYQKHTGLGMAMSQQQESKSSIEIGGIGLGVGTISSYARNSDKVDYYEINNLVVDIAQKYFSFIKDSKAEHHFFVGDGRIELALQDKVYDILVVDAFSGDSIPTHLLTKEAFKLYLDKISSDGVIALHISNNYLDLIPVVEGSLRSNNVKGFYVDLTDEDYASTWVLIGKNWKGNFKGSKVILWTDEKNNVLDVFEWSKFLTKQIKK